MMMSRSKAFSYGPRILTGSPLLSAVAGSPYIVTLTGTGGTQPYSYAIVSGAFAAGLTFTSLGVISGIPLSAQVDNVGVQLTDATGAKSTVVIFSLTVTATLSITTASPLPDGTQESTYPFTFAATGGFSPYIWSVISGSLPPVLALSSAGVLSGVTPNPGTYLFTVQAQDQLGVTTSKPFSLIIDPVFVATPTFFPGAGTYASSQSVAISTATPSGVIWYTLDGSTPTFPVTGTTVSYSGPITVSATETIRALASSPGSTNSPVASAAYVISTGAPGFKFFPGYILQSQNVDDVRKTGGTNNQVEINLIKPGSSTFGVINGYQPIYTYSSIMRGANGLGTVQGDYTKVLSDLSTDFNNLQAAYPGGLFAPRFQSDVNAGAWTNYTGGAAAHQFAATSGPVPGYILNCAGSININNKWDGSAGTTAFTLPVQQNNQCGFAYNDFSTPNYIGVATAAHEAAIEKDLENLFTYVLTVMTLPWPVASGGDGNNYTLDRHPLVPRINFGNEVSYDFTGGPADYIGTGVHAFSVTNFWTQYFNLAEFISTIAPRTPFGLNISAGVQSGSDGSTDTASSFNTANGYLSPAVANLGGRRGLPFIPGAYLSPSDTYGSGLTSHWNQNLGPQASNAMEANFGVQTATGESGSLPMPTPTNASMDGQWAVDAEFQTPDYNGSTSAGSHRFYNTPTQAASAFANNALGVGQLLQAALQAPPPGASLPAAFNNGFNACFISLTPCSQFRAGSPPTPGSDLADYGNYIHPTIVAAGLSTNQRRPNNLPGSTTPTLTITPAAPPDAAVGIPYEVQFLCNGTAPFNWLKVSGDAWLTIDLSAGLASGTPPAISSNPMVINVIDALGNLGTLTF